jgi:hypothetical protein
MCRRLYFLISFVLVLGMASYVSTAGADVEIPGPPEGQTPVIDGVRESMWEFATGQFIEKFMSGEDQVSSPADCSGTWWALADSEYLYVFIDVNDDALVQDSSPDSGWDDDRIEIFIDGDNSKNATPDMINDYQYCFRWNNAEVETPVEWYWRDSGINKLEGMEYGVTDSGTGYCIEVKLPWSTMIGGSPQKGDLIGIDVLIDDDDDGSGRDSQLSWYLESGPHTPVAWGTAELTELPLYKPVNEASKPKPENRQKDVPRDAILSWKQGASADKHDVYFDTDLNKVTDANRTNTLGVLVSENHDDCEYDPGILKLDTTYYWRIDEVNDPNIWRGNIWRFTTRNYLVVDDFESYTKNEPDVGTLLDTWIAGGGGTAGYPDPCHVELTIIHGDKQSLPFDYNNTKTPYYSEASRTFDTDQNWVSYKFDPTHIYPLKSMTLWFRGYPERVGSFSYTGTGNPYAATIYACGANIWNVADLGHPSLFHDECHFGYKEATSGTATTLPGSTTAFTGLKIVARVDSLGYPGDTVGKAGVMIRDPLDANALNGFMCVRRITGGGYGVAFSYRSTAKGGSTLQDVNDKDVNLPCWVGLILQSSLAQRNIRAYYSHNSTNGTDGKWYQLGPVQNYPTGTMTLPRTPGIYMGLAATPQSATATRIAKFSSVTLTAGAMGTWKSRDIGIKSNIAAPLYVTLQDSDANTAKVTHPDPYIVQQSTWQQWEIPLSDFKNKTPSLDLTKIKKITIGVGSGAAGGSGTLYFDDIWVYMPRCVAGAVAPDFTGSGCVVDNQDLRILTDNWLINEYPVTPATSWDPNNDANLAARYKFEGNYQDSKGSYNGDPCNTTVTIVNDAARGQVASFDGVNAYVSVPRMVQDDFTLSAWIKASTPGAQAGTRAYQGSGLIWSDVAGDFNDFILAVLGTKLASAIGPSTQDITSIGDVVTLAGQWVHVAVTRVRSSGQVKLYINGMLDRTSISSSTGSLTAYHEILIGANTIDGYYYKGLIDDVWIYSRALTETEVARLAGRTMTFNQPVSSLVTNPAVNLNNDGRIDIRDYAVLASKWLETLLWAP